MRSYRFSALAALHVLVMACAGASARQPADSEADTLLRTARKAHSDGNFTFAAEKFREFLAKFSGHRDVNSARYGLGLALLDLPERDYQKAFEALTPPATDAKFADRALALYYSGVSRRGQGLKELAAATAKSNELSQRQQNANARFAEAAKLFAQAGNEFEKMSPPDGEWSARAQCDTAEMELRLGKTKEARVTAEPFARDPKFAKSQFRPLGLYYHGFACFLLGDIAPSARSLNQLAPFDQSFGLHARYLIGRIHATQDERAEATAAFTAVLTSYEKQKKSAEEALKPPERFKNDPWERSRLEELAKGSVPDYVAAAAFHRACLHYEAGKFAEALPTFQSFAREYALSPLKDDAILRGGFCFVQTRNFDEAAKTLQPLVGHPKLGYQAMYWLGKAQLGKALASDPNDPNARTRQLATAINLFKDAAFKSGQLAAQGDMEAKSRRPEILLEQADAHLLAKQAQQAAQLYDQIFSEKLLPAKADEVLQRAATAYHLAGDLTGSEARIANFLQHFPDSPLLPVVLFRRAENAYLKAEQELKKSNPPAAREAFGAATTKYEQLIKQYPEFERVQRARYAQALCLTARDEWDKAAAVLEAIPAAERSGELAPVSYVLADCLIRTAPARAEDALTDNMLREKLTTAATLLDAFIAANSKAEQTPDALLKLGLCYRRLGTQLAPGNERNDAFNKARAALERVPRDFPQSPLIGSAQLERAKVIALQGDKGGAVNALRQFAGDPLQKSAVAPLALVALATLLREQNQAQAAADTLKQARDRFEGQLLKDPARVEWVPLLRYHHGVALFEAGRLSDARAAFEQAVQSGGDKPIAAESALKLLQCSAEESKKKLDALDKERQKGNLSPQQLADIDGRAKSVRGDLVAVATRFDQKAVHYKTALPESEARARMLYEAAWASRRGGADGADFYAKLIAQFPELALSVEARLELAELFVEAGKPDQGIKLLREAIDKEPTDRPTPLDTLERIRLRLGGVLFDKRDFAGAQGQFEAVAANDKSPNRGQGLYRAAECLLAQGKTDEAVKKLIVFRDNSAFHNIAGVSDRAVLRLGHGLLLLKQWEAARQAFEAVVNRYGNNNSWAVDARYGMGTALRNQGKFDEAVSAYANVTQMTQDDRAGRARLQIGECRAKQSRWADAGKEFQAVYYGYDIPELKYTAMIEHARVLVEEKKGEDALKLLRKVVEEAPTDSEWAKAAYERLAKLKK